MIKETPDITLPELREALAAKGASFGIGTPWRFFDRHGITLKKRQDMPRSRIAPTCSATGRLGSKVRSISIPRV